MQQRKAVLQIFKGILNPPQIILRVRIKWLIACK